jgi:hypothetical protein
MDGSGRQVADLFLELPSEEDYPDYYKEVSELSRIEKALCNRLSSSYNRTLTMI